MHKGTEVMMCPCLVRIPVKMNTRSELIGFMIETHERDVTKLAQVANSSDAVFWN